MEDIRLNSFIQLISEEELVQLNRNINQYQQKLLEKVFSGLIENIKPEETKDFLRDYFRMEVKCCTEENRKKSRFRTSKTLFNNCVIGLRFGVKKNRVYTTFVSYLINALWETMYVKVDKYLSTGMKNLLDCEKDIEEEVHSIYALAVFALDEFISKELGVSLKFLNALSLAVYEKRNSDGAEIIFYSEHDEFTELRNYIRVDSENLRQLRKLLEMTGMDSSILVDKDKDGNPFVKGLVYDKSYNKTNTLYKLRIEKEAQWKLYYKGHMVCGYNKGIYPAFKCEMDFYIKDKLGNKAYLKSKQDKSADKEQALQEAAAVKLDSSDTESSYELMEILNEALRVCTHGAIFIVVNDNEVRKDMLNRIYEKNAGFVFKKCVSLFNNKNLLPKLTAIDGALIIDNKGFCYGTGCILDGYTDNSVKYNMARGSRYNSTINFVKYCNSEKIFGIVLSEDGGIDIIRHNNC